MKSSSYWYEEWELAVAKLKEINDEITGIKRTENDKDVIEFDTNAYNIAKSYVNDCWSYYLDALNYEESGIIKKKRLTSIGRCGTYGF